MKQDLSETKVFRDPLYGYVKVNHQLIWELIQTKEFQRLRRIKQLGGTFLVYHTAEHSRFSHSLGTYEVARRIITEVDDIRDYLDDYEKMIVLCAALLHDLGHGPYSHAFESVFQMHHEAYTNKIILGNTEVNQVLERHYPGIAIHITNVINGKCENEVINNLISSQLDVDRLDYLQRDAYFTGATYGSIDLERLIRSFNVINNKIVFKHNSMHAIENYLISRYHMYWQVYYHPTGISFEITLILLFRRLKVLLNESNEYKAKYPIINKIFTKMITVEEYLMLDEPWIITKIKELSNETDLILSQLANRILSRKLFKYYECRDENHQNEIYDRLKDQCDILGIDRNYNVYKDILQKDTYQYYNKEKIKNQPIELYNGECEVEITEVSHIVNHVKKKQDYKVYFSEELLPYL